MLQIIDSMKYLSSVLSLLAWLASPMVCLADESRVGNGAIRISVRAIQASVPVQEGTLEQLQAAPQGRTIQVDAALRDLQTKLAHLPFNNFHLISSKEETISVKSRDSLQLPNGQSLMFRPVSMEHHKVGLWLNWKDRDGSEILNTRVHFDSQDTVLTGTDCAHNEGMILAIKATEIEQ